MALQVWLPLNGDLENKGFSNITITNNGATIDDNGKIGKCYAVGNGKYLSGLLDMSSSEWSICAWVYSTGGLSGTVYVICLHSANSSSDFYGGLQLNGSNSFIVRIAGSTYTLGSITTEVWHHLCITFKNNIAYGYVDGILLKSVSTTTPTATSTRLMIGRRYNSASYYFDGKLNDVRIYDHCLSAKEVHEISQGLVLHYKLDNISSNENLLPISSQRLSVNGSTSSNEYMNLCSTLQIYETYGLVPYTISFEIKAAVPYSFNIYGTYGSNPKYAFTSKSINVTTEWQRFSYTFTPYVSNSSGTWAGISVYGVYGSGAIVSVRNVKFELGTKSTPITNQINIIYDCSGYQHHANIIGSLTANTSTPRYNYSSSMNNTSTSNHIESEPIAISDNIFTVSFWIKAAKSTNQVFVADPKIVIGTLNSLLYVVTTSSPPFTTTNFVNNEWNHIVIVRNGTIYKAYINGIAETQSGSNNYYGHSVAKLWLLNRSTNNTYAANTSISDFRVYATELSEEDILALYNNPANIDNQGDMFSFEFDEEETNKQQILQSGITKINNFIEINDKIKILDDGSVFLQILHHNNPASNLFTVSICWLNNDENLYSSII